MPTIHVDLRELSGLPVDAYVPSASLRVAPAQRVHVEDGDDYIRVENFLTVKIVDGIADFDLPETGLGEAVVVNEDGWRGAATRYVAIPSGAGPVNYGDLVEVDPSTFDPTVTPEAAWWSALDLMVTDGSLVGDDLVLERQGGGTIDVGSVRGGPGADGGPGPPGPAGIGVGWHVVAAPTGVAATDTAAIAAAVTACGSRGVAVLQNGTYWLNALQIIPDGVDLRGQGGGSTSRAGTTTIKCTTAAAKIEIAGGGGLCGGFEIDGNSTATTCFRRSGGTGANARTFHNITAHHNLPASATNDLAEFYGAQNDLFIQCGFANADRDLGHFDQGFGGTTFLRCQWRTAGRYHQRYAADVAGGVYLVPTDIHHYGSIMEGNGGTSLVKVTNGTDISWDNQTFYSIAAVTGPMFDIDTSVAGMALHNPVFQSTPSTLVAGTKAIAINAVSSLTISGRAMFLNFDKPLNLNTNTAFIYETGQCQFFNCNAPINVTGSAGVEQVGPYRVGTTNFNNALSTGLVEISANAARTAFRSARLADGTLWFYPGTAFTKDTAFGRRAVGAVGVQAGTQQVLVTGGGSTAQRPAAADAIFGAVYFNTTTNKPNYCWGLASGWKDATGAAV